MDVLTVKDALVAPAGMNTLEGFSVNEERVGGGIGTGVTVSEADLVTPP